MRTCFFVAGTLGSEMNFDNGIFGEAKIWVSYQRLARGQAGLLELADDGVSPGGPDGVACTPGGPLPDYYDGPLEILREQLGTSYAVVPFGYDWRTITQPDGVRLAAEVRSAATLADPATIVAHSQGAFVARAAWADLVRSGDTGLCRRIITLGGPHEGLYATVGLFCGNNAALEQLSLINQALYLGAPIGPNRDALLQSFTLPDLVRMACTWPVMYEMFPLLGVDAHIDPARFKLFDAANWAPVVPIKQRWLDHARLVWQPFLNSPASQPPAHVMTVLGGKGRPTFNRLALPAQLGEDDCLGMTPDGDGTCTFDSATALVGSAWDTDWEHVSMVADAASSAWLVGAILEERSPIEPPPPERSVAPGVQSGVAGPPFPMWPLGNQRTACPGGKCSC